VTYPFSTPSCFISAPAAVEETAKSRAFPRRVARVLPVKKIKSSTAITGLLKSVTEAARSTCAGRLSGAPNSLT
jgi:hypothetical protein